VHYIYPENSLQEGWRWKGHHKLVLTVHQPAEYLELMRKQDAHAGFFMGLQVADVVIATDPETLEAHRAYAPKARLEIIPHGVDTEFFRSSSVSPKCPIILTIGNWLRDYECWAKVVRELSMRLPDVRFEVVANSDTLRYAQSVLGANSSRVGFLTGLSDFELRAAYARARLMFLPLKNTAANNAVLESLAMGLPLVVTDLPASRFYVGAEAGRYIHNADIEGCVATLAGLLTDDAQEHESMAAAARARAVTEFSWPRVADRYRGLYRSLFEPL
jgi:glycosyltransferase involved in cell wall biosynthesis